MNSELSVGRKKGEGFRTFAGLTSRIFFRPFLTRGALSTWGHAKSNFLSVSLPSYERTYIG
jgi:hypothetical protein